MKVSVITLPLFSSPLCDYYPNSALLIADVSGFTKLNELFSNQGAGGAEQVTTHLNAYFTKLLDIIERHCGDCHKIAGDALIVVFTPHEMNQIFSGGGGGGTGIGTGLDNNGGNANGNAKEGGGEGGRKVNGMTPKEKEQMSQQQLKDQQQFHQQFDHSDFDYNDPSTLSLLSPLDFHSSSLTTLRAVQCALELQSQVSVYKPNSSISLTLHIGISSGNLYGMHVGGVESQWEFLLAGAPFKQITNAVELSSQGEVVVSARSWGLIEHLCVGEKINHPKAQGEMLIRQVIITITTSSTSSHCSSSNY